jgi:MarR family transcriptional regulator for hemolysin
MIRALIIRLARPLLLSPLLAMLANPPSSKQMINYDFDASVGYWINTVHQSYMRAFNEKLAPHGITFRQVQLLAWLASEGPMSQSELAARMFIEPPSLVGIIDRAEQAGLIERRVSDSDRRCKMIYLLPGAQKVWARIAQVALEMRALATQDMTEEEVATLLQLLQKVRNNVSALQPV